jgi:hypothetical protein
VALKRQNDEYLNHIALALTIKLLLIKIFPKYLVQQKKQIVLWIICPNEDF